ncbi:MAG: cyclase family protein [Acidobacteriota bacterium]
MIRIDFNGHSTEFDENAPIDISIPMNFGGPQPNAYGIETATVKACEYGPLVGDTRRGGSCNFEQVTLIPHCNGTHTECVGHITNERISVRGCLKDILIPAILVSVQPANDSSDLVITREILGHEVERSGPNLTEALIVRTLPNDESKLWRQYVPNDTTSPEMPPYFTTEAMQYIVGRGFKHLLVDLPSIDRMYDEGKLLNHRIFWNVAVGSFDAGPNARRENTITELIYVPNEIEDGEYLLNLQIAPFESDASPSRPLLFRASRAIGL